MSDEAPTESTAPPGEEARLQAFSQALGAALATPLKPTSKPRTHQYIEVTAKPGVLDETLAEMKRRGVKVLGFDRRGGARVADDVWRIKIMEPTPCP